MAIMELSASVVLLFLFSLFIVGSASNLAGDDWDGTISITDGSISWKVFASAASSGTPDSITFLMEVKTSGWIGLGWGPEDKKMKNADMVILAGKNLDVKDYFSYGTTTPEVDTVPNLLDVTSGQKGGRTWMQFTRLLVTDDNEMDVPITVGKVDLIWAFGDRLALDYHRQQRGLKRVTLIRPPSEWDGTKKFAGGAGKLSWKVKGEDITFRVECDTHGWLGIGFDPEDEKMENADMVILTGHADDWEISDYFSLGMSLPRLDSSQDVTPINKGTTDSGGVFMEFSRKLDTGDMSEDKVITTGTTSVIWAFGESGDLSYHARHRGLMHIQLVSEVTADSTVPLTDQPSSQDGGIPDTWDGTQEFSGGTFSWKASWDSIVMDVQADITGWLAIGWSPDDGKMLNADMIIMGGSDLVVKDYFSLGMTKPQKDDQQDVTVLRKVRDGGKMVMTFRRNMKTNDEEQDREIKMGEEVIVIWAYGKENDVAYHNSNRGSFSVVLVDEDKIQNPEDALYTKGDDGYYYKDNVPYERVHVQYYPVNQDGYAQIGDLYYKHGIVYLIVNGAYVEGTEEGFYLKDGFFWKNNIPYAHQNGLYFELNADGFYSYQSASWKDGVKYIHLDGSYCKLNDDGYCLRDNSYWDSQGYKYGYRDGTYILCNPDGFFFYNGFWWRNDLRYTMKDGRYFRA